MGSLHFRVSKPALFAVLLLLFLPACGGHKSAPPSPIPAKIALIPATSFSLQVGTVLQFAASAQNNANTTLAPTFTFASSNASILDVAPNGAACAGSWNAPLYTVCTPGGVGEVQVTASALGATSAPTLIFVHPPIDTIEISVVTPVSPPPPACPSQTALPAACNIQFNTSVCQPNQPCACLSANQVQTLQARAFSQGVEITKSVGPFTWSEANTGVFTVTPIVDPTITVATNQISIAPGTPGQTNIIASASGVSSQPYATAEACPVTCIDLQLSANGSQQSGQTSFVANKGTSETIVATAVDVQGCIVPKPALTWVSSAPAALSVSTGCSATNTCIVSTSQPGSASISASCTPPTCNIGFPLNPVGYVPPSLFIPEPVYPTTAISGLVTGATSATSVLITTQDCRTSQTCSAAMYNVLTSANVPGAASQVPTPPNSLLFDPAGDRAYMGSDFGAQSVAPASVGMAGAFTALLAPGTPLGVVSGKVLAVSTNGSQAIFSDAISSPNQVYVTGSGASATMALNINDAISAAFSPDGLRAYILGNGGNSVYAYSPLEALQTLAPAPAPLPIPATSIAFSSTGAFALLAGGGAPGSLAAYNTCDNSPITPALSAGTILTPPLFLRMVPAANVPAGNPTIFGNPPVTLQSAGLDFFFGVDNTGIDVIATTSSIEPLPLPPGQLSPATLCPRPVVLAQTTTSTTFNPIHINIGQGSFHPINFFLSPDSTQVYIVTSDFGILVYNFNTHSTRGFQLINNAVPLAADITVDGSLMYVTGSDGLLHVVNTATGADTQPPISFSPLPNSPNSFCYTGENCAPNILAVKP